MWSKLSTGKTIGYVGAHIIAALLALSILVWIIPYDQYLEIPSLYFGVKKIYPNIDFMSVLTIEIIANIFLYFGYVYYRELQQDKQRGILYYGGLAMALSIATYDLTGGAFNSALFLGGLVFENVVDYRYIGILIGQLTGCLMARLLIW